MEKNRLSKLWLTYGLFISPTKWNSAHLAHWYLRPPDILEFHTSCNIQQRMWEESNRHYPLPLLRTDHRYWLMDHGEWESSSIVLIEPGFLTGKFLTKHIYMYQHLFFYAAPSAKLGLGLLFFFTWEPMFIQPAHICCTWRVRPLIESTKALKINSNFIVGVS